MPDAASDAELRPAAPDAGDVADAHLAIDTPIGSRVQLHGLKSAAALNGSFGVVLRLDGGSGRLVVRKEVAPPGEAPTVTVKPANLRPAPPLDGPAVQALVDAAPAGARVTLPRGTISAPAASSTAAPIALRLPRALTLAGVGSKTGGTVLSGFSVVVGEEVDGGGLLELVGFHVSGGAVDVSPMELSRVRLSDVSVTAPAGTMAAVYIDEIGSQLLGRAEEEERVVLDGCWVRGGVNGVVVNAVGCTLRHCRAQGAAQYGVHANASVALEACTVGGCGKAGVLARAGLTELRSAGGINENRIQRDAWDKSYNGFSATSNANACACTSFFQFAQAYSMMQGGGIGKVLWAPAGQGRWTNTADYLPQKS